MAIQNCSKCRQDFEKTNGNNYCPSCHAEYGRKWYQRNKDKVRNTQFKLKYGITLKEYNSLSEAQNHVCAICGKPAQEKTGYSEEGSRRLVVDHDHEFGYTRGLLCGKCNRGIGMFEDNIEFLKAAIKYLEEWQV